MLNSTLASLNGITKEQAQAEAFNVAAQAISRFADGGLHDEKAMTAHGEQVARAVMAAYAAATGPAASRNTKQARRAKR